MVKKLGDIIKAKIKESDLSDEELLQYLQNVVADYKTIDY